MAFHAERKGSVNISNQLCRTISFSSLFCNSRLTSLLSSSSHRGGRLIPCGPYDGSKLWRDSSDQMPYLGTAELLALSTGHSTANPPSIKESISFGCLAHSKYSPDGRDK
nr:hypothetical protein Itr_chr12CG31560 [Ipomoea trifida]